MILRALLGAKKAFNVLLLLEMFVLCCLLPYAL